MSLRASSFLGAALLLLGACDPFHTGFDDNEAPRSYHASRQSVPDPDPVTLRVMTYNIKFGGGRIDFFFDCHGDRVLMTQSEVIEQLEALARFVDHIDPDLLFLQEVEINSKRSAYVDQVRWLLEHTALNHAVYASAWRADYVPSDGLGAVDMGNAILSKYPLTDAKRIALPLIGEQSALERYFYLRRNLLLATVQLPRAPLRAITTHTSAFSKDGTKLRQIEILKRIMDEQSALGMTLAGGDLNTLPPGSEKTHEFPDSVCVDEAFIADDYREETAWLEPLYEDYTPAVSLTDYQADNARYFTHTTDSEGFWNRKLDYLFTNAGFEPGSARTHQDMEAGHTPMRLSDHAPVSALLRLR